MKQNYIKPAIKAMNVTIEPLMATSDTIYSTEKGADNSAVLTRGRRGAWGNLWNEPEE